MLNTPSQMLLPHFRTRCPAGRAGLSERRPGGLWRLCP